MAESALVIDMPCGGIRGLQRMRRSRSTSRVAGHGGAGGKPRRNKVPTAQEYFSKHMLDLDILLARDPLAPLAPLKPLALAAALKKAVPAPVQQKQVAKCDVVQAKQQLAPTLRPRYFYGKAINSYEEFYNLVQGDDMKFDDEYLAGVKSLVRHYFGQAIYSYEEFYNLVQDDDTQFDDEYVPDVKNHCRYYYGQEIHSYEEFYNLVGGDDAHFDDEHVEEFSAKASASQSRCYFGKEICSYEEFYILVGGVHDVFDDEAAAMQLKQKKAVRSFYGREIQSYEELYHLAGAEAKFDDETP
jgi:hypothetical protein